MMATTLVQSTLTFDEFLARYGEDDRFELIDGELFDLEPTGPHEEVAAFIGQHLNAEILRLGLKYLLPHRCLIKPLGTSTGFRPDIVVLDKAALSAEPLWRREPVITLGSSVKLVAEVVSSNWQNDYARKVEDYAALEIPEYWIADYAALGGERFLGSPKHPALTVYTLNGRRYQEQMFRGNETIVSQLFPSLQLTAAQILDSWKEL
jgi:Uma2 family endonuclease